MQLMQQESSIKIKQLKVDGGACANNFLMQFQADLLAITINRPNNIESTVLGATILAAIGNNIWCAETVPEILYEQGDCFTGQLPKTACTSLVADWHNAVNKCLVVN
jgi:glycerol kinase